MKKKDFFKIVLKDYKLVGAVAPSSSYAVRRIMHALKPNVKYIIEYGAGDGVVTKALLNALPADGKLVAIELQKDCAELLEKISDSRLKVINEDVITVSKKFSQLKLPRIDAIVSGIPFSFLKPEEREELISASHEALVEGGQFIGYQATPYLHRSLRKRFSKVKAIFEVRNLPPYFITVAEK